MNASPTVGRPIRVPLEESLFWSAGFRERQTSGCTDEGRANQIRHLLKRAGLTMTQVSALTRTHYGPNTPYFIPASFLYKLKKGTTPHICQIAALSRFTGYRFAEWMKLCGFDLKLVLALQLKLHEERTAIVTPDQDFLKGHSLLGIGGHQKSQPRYLFAKIGRRDAVVYPRLAPGSIVRADRWYSLDALEDGFAHERIWLVQHSGGLICCFVKRIDYEHVCLLPERPPLTPWPLSIPREARLLGLVDLELRPHKTAPVEPMCGSGKRELLPAPPRGSTHREFSLLLQTMRSRAGLTFRAAHQMTRRIASLLGSTDYAISLGLLSDYEALNKIPRHVAKIMSLCIIYGIDPLVLIEAGGICINESGETSCFPEHRERTFSQSA